jgi:hypothetical protein
LQIPEELLSLQPLPLDLQFLSLGKQIALLLSLLLHPYFRHAYFYKIRSDISSIDSF